MSSLVKLLLKGSIPKPQGKGRSIRFFKDETCKVTKGSLEERIIDLLSEASFPLNVHEISRHIGSNSDKVAPRVKRLVNNDILDSVNNHGTLPAYYLKIRK